MEKATDTHNAGCDRQLQRAVSLTVGDAIDARLAEHNHAIAQLVEMKHSLSPEIIKAPVSVIHRLHIVF